VRISNLCFADDIALLSESKEIPQTGIINQSINLFVMKHSTRNIAVTALTGTTGLKSAYGSPK